MRGNRPAAYGLIRNLPVVPAPYLVIPATSLPSFPRKRECWSLAVWEQGGSRFGALRTAVSTVDGPSSRYPRSEPLAALFIPAKSPSFSGHPPLVGTKMGLNSPVPHISAR